MTPIRTALLIAVAGLLIACDSVQLAPKVIEADGTTYFACSGLVWFNSDGAGYRVSFTDQDGRGNVLVGIKKVSISDLPSTVPAPLHYPLPSPWDLDKNGNPYKEGVPYTWSDGTKAILRDGQWQAVMVRRDLCQARALQ